jgi:SET family sugar efflux transporter-like MFS transporter
MHGHMRLALSSNPVVYVLRDPLYRAFFLVPLVVQVGVGAAFPFVSLWAARVLGADPTRIGLLFTVSGLAGVASTVLIGAATDRTGRRVGWLLAIQALAVAAWVGMAFTTSYTGAITLNTLASIGGSTLVFALLGDWLRHRREPRAAEVHSTVRFALALGFLAGPMLGGLLAGRLGFSVLFLATALAMAVGLLSTLRWFHDAPPSEAPLTDAKPRSGSTWPFVLYTLGSVIAFAALPSRFILIPLFVTDRLGATIEMVGLLFTFAVVCELPLFLLVGRLVQRFGAVRLLAAGFGAQVLYFTGLTLATEFWQLIAIEPLFAFTVATTANIGMLYVQDLLPRRTGAAVASSGAAFQLGPVLSAPLLGYLSTELGWSGAFFVSAAFSLLGGSIFLLSARAARTLRAAVPIAQG